MKSLLIQRFYDMHLHLRDGEMLKVVAPITARHFHQAVVMPNLTPPICSVDDVEQYRQRIMDAVGTSDFKPLMTFKILPDTNPQSIHELAKLKYLVAGKVYPKGLTTNAQDGVDDFFGLRPILLEMQAHDLVSCWHGEMPGKHLMGRDREQAFLPTLRLLAHTYPKLRIVLEHITTAAAVETVLSLPANVAATITVHHLMLTHDDVGGDRMCPNNYCKPIAKDPADREALLQAATSGCPKFFFGSDSAPHPKDGKQKLYDCCAGIFSTPVAPGLLAQIFEQRNASDRLEQFVSLSGKQFYRLPKPHTIAHSHLKLIKKSWAVPDEISGIVPFCAGQTIDWQVEDR